MTIMRIAKFNIGQAVRHRLHDFGGIIEDVDAEFSGTEEWFNAIPEDIRPDRNQPFYRVIVDDHGEEAVAYVSEQNLVADVDGVSTPITSRVAEAVAALPLH